MHTTHALPRITPLRRLHAGVSLLDIRDPATINTAVTAIQSHPVLIQLPAVFALLAAPTSEGARQLDACKKRLKGKNYGTAIGSLHRFVTEAQGHRLPAGFNTAAALSRLEGAFIRLPFGDPGFQSPVIKDGRHQGLLLGGPYRQLFAEIERSYAVYPPDAMWGGAHYTAPLATSCNISGHPEGSIVTLDKAMVFARERGIPFIITSADKAASSGSYPVLGFEQGQVSVHRGGPGLEGLLGKISPASKKNGLTS